MCNGFQRFYKQHPYAHFVESFELKLDPMGQGIFKYVAQAFLMQITAGEYCQNIPS